jgi:hypothetical protein
MRDGSPVAVKLSNYENPKISRWMTVVVDSRSIISKVPKTVWEELRVKPLCKHWQTEKPAGLVSWGEEPDCV